MPGALKLTFLSVAAFLLVPEATLQQAAPAVSKAAGFLAKLRRLDDRHDALVARKDHPSDKVHSAAVQVPVDRLRKRQATRVPSHPKTRQPHLRRAILKKRKISKRHWITAPHVNLEARAPLMGGPEPDYVLVNSSGEPSRKTWEAESQEADEQLINGTNLRQSIRLEEGMIKGLAAQKKKTEDQEKSIEEVHNNLTKKVQDAMSVKIEAARGRLELEEKALKEKEDNLTAMEAAREEMEKNASAKIQEAEDALTEMRTAEEELEAAKNRSMNATKKYSMARQEAEADAFNLQAQEVLLNGTLSLTNRTRNRVNLSEKAVEHLDTILQEQEDRVQENYDRQMATAKQRMEKLTEEEANATKMLEGTKKEYEAWEKAKSEKIKQENARSEQEANATKAKIENASKAFEAEQAEEAKEAERKHAWNMTDDWAWGGPDGDEELSEESSDSGASPASAPAAATAEVGEAETAAAAAFKLQPHQEQADEYYYHAPDVSVAGSPGLSTEDYLRAEVASLRAQLAKNKGSHDAKPTVKSGGVVTEVHGSSIKALNHNNNELVKSPSYDYPASDVSSSNHDLNGADPTLHDELANLRARIEQVTGQSPPSASADSPVNAETTTLHAPVITAVNASGSEATGIVNSDGLMNSEAVGANNAQVDLNAHKSKMSDVDSTGGLDSDNGKADYEVVDGKEGSKLNAADLAKDDMLNTEGDNSLDADYIKDETIDGDGSASKVAASAVSHPSGAHTEDTDSSSTSPPLDEQESGSPEPDARFWADYTKDENDDKNEWQSMMKSADVDGDSAAAGGEATDGASSDAASSDGHAVDEDHKNDERDEKDDAGVEDHKKDEHDEKDDASEEASTNDAHAIDEDFKTDDGAKDAHAATDKDEKTDDATNNHDKKDNADSKVAAPMAAQSGEDYVTDENDNTADKEWYEQGMPADDLPAAVHEAEGGAEKSEGSETSEEGAETEEDHH